MRSRRFGWTLLILANFAAWGVLSLRETTTAAPTGAQPPFANSLDQRDEMIRELRAIKDLIKEQNELLAAGAKKQADTPAR